MTGLSTVRYLMGTFIRVDVIEGCSDSKAVESVFTEVKRLEKVFSRFIENSQVYKINKFAYLEPQEIDSELFSLIKICKEWSRITSGLFEITTECLTELWSKAEKQNTLPFEIDIAALISSIGNKNIVLNEEKSSIFFKNKNCRIDLGASAKGYALDKVTDILRKSDIKKALIDFGGNLYLLDETKGEPEKVGIRDPQKEGGIIAKVPLKNQAISTSGSYERFFTIKGKRYSHIINPLTGWPEKSDVVSASVISSSGLIADILSTSIMLLGFKKGMRLIENIDGVSSIIITSNSGKLKINFSGKLKPYPVSVKY